MQGTRYDALLCLNSLQEMTIRDSKVVNFKREGEYVGSDRWCPEPESNRHGVTPEGF